LIEEICMLDQLSGGRFELGVGRGISPYELAYNNVDFLAAAEIYEEALQIILAGLTSKTLTYHGRHYQFRGVPMELEPVQRPHPPLWQGVTSAESAIAAAKRGASVVGHGPIPGLRPIVDAYLGAWDGKAPGAGLVRQPGEPVAQVPFGAVPLRRDARDRAGQGLSHRRLA